VDPVAKEQQAIVSEDRLEQSQKQTPIGSRVQMMIVTTTAGRQQQYRGQRRQDGKFKFVLKLSKKGWFLATAIHNDVLMTASVKYWKRRFSIPSQNKIHSTSRNICIFDYIIVVA
jgi:hypothetical protein